MTGVAANRKVTTVIYRANRAILNASEKCWLNYATDGKIFHRGTTWATEHLVSGVPPANRPLVVLEPDGLMMIIK